MASQSDKISKVNHSQLKQSSSLHFLSHVFSTNEFAAIFFDVSPVQYHPASHDSFLKAESKSSRYLSAEGRMASLHPAVMVVFARADGTLSERPSSRRLCCAASAKFKLYLNSQAWGCFMNFSWFCPFDLSVPIYLDGLNSIGLSLSLCLRTLPLSTHEKSMFPMW